MSEQKLQVYEIGTVGERLNKLIDHFCKGNKTAFGRAANIQSGVLAGIVGGRSSKPGFEILQKLLTAYPTVDPDWLLFGREPMLREVVDVSSKYILDKLSDSGHISESGREAAYRQIIGPELDNHINEVITIRFNALKYEYERSLNRRLHNPLPPAEE